MQAAERFCTARRSNPAGRLPSTAGGLPRSPARNPTCVNPACVKPTRAEGDPEPPPRSHRLYAWWISRSFVSGRNKVPITAVMTAMTIGYQSP
ncbi:hypothetical protein AMYX_15810 [Anaeromyxobacter diazotrophicus]|uniref:Uncharacterized protein n=1 Tax=Anaeromyxobacter diazotrophicus TaxID=2590199 RepID=A0A7I9VL36_9BACT|nr:hypothetical protein AMYX_15810 [Anaeromyxobacter diazotrophicus]